MLEIGEKDGWRKIEGRPSPTEVSKSIRIVSINHIINLRLNKAVSATSMMKKMKIKENIIWNENFDILCFLFLSVEPMEYWNTGNTGKKYSQYCEKLKKFSEDSLEIFLRGFWYFNLEKPGTMKDYSSDRLFRRKLYRNKNVKSFKPRRINFYKVIIELNAMKHSNLKKEILVVNKMKPNKSSSSKSGEKTPETPKNSRPRDFSSGSSDNKNKKRSKEEKDKMMTDSELEAELEKQQRRESLKLSLRQYDFPDQSSIVQDEVIISDNDQLQRELQNSMRGFDYENMASGGNPMDVSQSNEGLFDPGHQKDNLSPDSVIAKLTREMEARIEQSSAEMWKKLEFERKKMNGEFADAKKQFDRSLQEKEQTITELLEQLNNEDNIAASISHRNHNRTNGVNSGAIRKQHYQQPIANNAGHNEGENDDLSDESVPDAESDFKMDDEEVDEVASTGLRGEELLEELVSNEHQKTSTLMIIMHKRYPVEYFDEESFKLMTEELNRSFRERGGENQYSKLKGAEPKQGVIAVTVKNFATAAWLITFIEQNYRKLKCLPATYVTNLLPAFLVWVRDVNENWQTLKDVLADEVPTHNWKLIKKTLEGKEGQGGTRFLFLGSNFLKARIDKWIKDNPTMKRNASNKLILNREWKFSYKFHQTKGSMHYLIGLNKARVNSRKVILFTIIKINLNLFKIKKWILRRWWTLNLLKHISDWLKLKKESGCRGNRGARSNDKTLTTICSKDGEAAMVIQAKESRDWKNAANFCLRNFNRAVNRFYEVIFLEEKAWRKGKLENFSKAYSLSTLGRRENRVKSFIWREGKVELRERCSLIKNKSKDELGEGNKRAISKLNCLLSLERVRKNSNKIMKVQGYWENRVKSFIRAEGKAELEEGSISKRDKNYSEPRIERNKRANRGNYWSLRLERVRENSIQLREAQGKLLNLDLGCLKHCKNNKIKANKVFFISTTTFDIIVHSLSRLYWISNCPDFELGIATSKWRKENWDNG